MPYKPPVPVIFEIGNGDTPTRCIVIHPAGSVVIDPRNRLKDLGVMRYLTGLVVHVLMMSWTMEHCKVSAAQVAKAVNQLADVQDVRIIYNALGYQQSKASGTPGGPLPANSVNFPEVFSGWPYTGWLVDYDPRLHGELD